MYIIVKKKNAKLCSEYGKYYDFIINKVITSQANTSSTTLYRAPIMVGDFSDMTVNSGYGYLQLRE